MEIEFLVEELHASGAPLGRSPDGRVCFSDWGWPGERLRARVVKERPRYLLLSTIEVLTASAQRRLSPCPHFGRSPGSCGGCQWSDIQEEEQLRWKQERVERALARFSPDTEVLPIWASQSWGYRNRVQLKVTPNAVGFVSPGTKVLAPVQQCMVCTPKIQEILTGLVSQLPNQEFQPQDPYLWNFMDLDEDLVEPKINIRRPFRQGNTTQNDRMKAWVKDHCTVAGQSVLELFAGSGNFTEPLSRLGATVLAVELQEEAVRKLKSFESVVVYERNLFHQKDVETLASELPDYSVLFLDPPREGCPHLKSFLLPKLQQVYYVSCDLESFVRDAKQLQRASFVLQSVQPVDMFPQTPHIELLAKFQR